MPELRSNRRTDELAPLGARVLLVDDDENVLNGLGDLLTEEGFTVIPAPNGAVALDLLRMGLRADAIVLDVVMPVLDGWSFRAAQREDPALRDIPVVVITGWDLGRDTIREELEAYRVLPKPLAIDDFVRTLREVCGLEGVSRSTSRSGL